MYPSIGNQVNHVASEYEINVSVKYSCPVFQKVMLLMKVYYLLSHFSFV